MANKREAIVDATIRHIAEQGGSFPTSLIAEDVGCSQSLIFRYFGSKELLFSACFDKVCLELKEMVSQVELPSDINRNSMNDYLIRLWEAYAEYLQSNSQVARAYTYFISSGRMFPRGCRDADDVIRKILGDQLERIKRAYPDFVFVTEYIILVSNLVVTGNFLELKNMGEAMGKMGRVLKFGIYG
ncbi:MAG: TetR/AcrR family transcriptional regulator [Candidatus Methanomethylophilus sp.]|nr:TetR/AcrR family transcriptional regulator [Methanomethylophilus sp.]